MVKKYFFVIFFLIFAFRQVSGGQNKETQKANGCSYEITPNYLKDIDGLKINLIEIDIHELKYEFYKKYLEIRKPNLHKMAPIPICVFKEDN